MKIKHGFIAGLMALTAFMAVPSMASADVADGYTGWGSVEQASTYYVGYRWTGSNWVRVDRRGGTVVYIAPYTTGWSWTWTSATGWLAVQSANLVGSTSDTTAPVLSTITSVDTTTTRTVTLGLAASDAVGVTQMRLANENDTVWSSWRAFDDSFDWTLSAGAGTKRVYVQVRDAAGNVSSARVRTITYAPAAADTTAPVLTSVGAPTTTTSRTVAVTLVASDAVAVTRMRLAGEDGVWGAWTTYDDSFDRTLSSGYGAKILFVQVADAAGNVSKVMYRRITYAAS